MEPSLYLLSFLDYVRAAWRAGVRSPALGFHYGGHVVAWSWAARVPWYGRRLLTHEWWHTTPEDTGHAPWWSFRVECGHALRFRDPARLVDEARPWMEANGL